MIRQETCAVCGFPENCDFKVMDDAWKTIVPIRIPQSNCVCEIVLRLLLLQNK
jgi:hypothetical protein